MNSEISSRYVIGELLFFYGFSTALELTIKKPAISGLFYCIKSVYYNFFILGFV